MIAAQAGRVLIATTPVGKSHMMNLKKIAKEVEQRGNTVMVSPAADCIYATLLTTYLHHERQRNTRVVLSLVQLP